MIGAPPAANILGEIRRFIAIMNFSVYNRALLCLGAFLAGFYSLTLFSYVFHNSKTNLNIRFIPLSLIEGVVILPHIF